jgi:hypothetical protein
LCYERRGLKIFDFLTTATSLRGRRSILQVDGVRSESLLGEAFPVKDFGTFLVLDIDCSSLSYDIFST